MGNIEMIEDLLKIVSGEGREERENDNASENVRKCESKREKP